MTNIGQEIYYIKVRLTECRQIVIMAIYIFNILMDDGDVLVLSILLYILGSDINYRPKVTCLHTVYSDSMVNGNGVIMF